MGLNLMTKMFCDAMFYKLHTTTKYFKLCYIKEHMNCNVMLDIASLKCFKTHNTILQASTMQSYKPL